MFLINVCVLINFVLIKKKKCVLIKMKLKTHILYPREQQAYGYLIVKKHKFNREEKKFKYLCLKLVCSLI